MVYDQLFFTALGQNPYQPGPASSWTDRRERDIQLNRTDGPTIRFPPEPSPGFVRAGVRTEGYGGISLETNFNSGMLDIRYPVASELRVPDANSVRAGGAFSVGLSSEARSLFNIDRVNIGATSVSMFRSDGRSFGGGSSLMAPNIRTTFPSLSGRLDLFYQQRNSAFIEGCGEVPFTGIRVCGDIIKGDLPSFPRLQQTVASFGPDGIFVLPGTSAQKAGYTFGTPISLGGYADLTVNYPKVATNGGLVGPTKLSSFGEKPLVELKVDIDQIISDFVLRPSLLPPLNGDFGPAKYNLLELEGSLFATLYQQFGYDPRVRTKLRFDQWVRNGNSGPLLEVDLGAGETLDNLRLLNPFADQVNVRPTYYLDGKLVAETGIGFGAGIDAKALRLQLGPLDTGWAVEDGDETVFARVKLSGQEFVPKISAIAGRDFTIDFRSALELSDGMTTTVVGNSVTALDPTGKSGRFNVPLFGVVNGDAVALGSRPGILSYADGSPVGSAYEYVTAKRDVFFRPDDASQIDYDGYAFPVPDFFCARCISALLPDPVPTAVIVLDDGTVINASDAPPDIALLLDGPSLFGGTSFGGTPTGVVIESQGPISEELRVVLGLTDVPVPAPGPFGLLGLSLVLLAATRRR